ncbi:MAG TPA: hypothetical protein VF618_15300 [Thermoanaerobaculia bacterium]
MSKTALLRTSQFESAAQELRARGARIAVTLPDGYVLARVPDSFEEAGLEAASVARDKDDRIVRIFRESQAVLNSTPRGHGLRWDSPGFQSPLQISDPEEIRTLFRNAKGGVALSTGTPTSLVMTGRVAVGVVVVSGPSSDGLTFSQGEIDNVYSQVLAGVDYLAGANPEVGLSFTLEMNPVTITAAPPSSCSSYESCESVWRNPALAILGYSPDRAGSVQYAEDLQAQQGVDWGYVAYFTKYPVQHFAYASSERLVMQYSNDGWGPGNIHRVFAHETGHIFGAADEYGDCTCGGSYGYFGAPNNNCVNCDGEHFKCLMDTNDLVLCTWSRRQIGWNAWSEQTDITSQNDAKSSDKPALAVYNGQLWMAYRGASSSTLYSAPFNGTSWQAQVDITSQNGAKSSYGPGLAAYGGKLWAAYRGDGSGNIYASAYDGSKWGDQTKVTDKNDAKTSRGPALCEYNGRLYMVYRGESSGTMYLASFDGTNWSAQTNITDKNSAKTSETPGLAVFNGLLYVVYRGEASSTLWSFTTDGTNYSGQTEITSINDAKSSSGPRIGVLGNLLWMVFRGENSSTIYSCAFDGTTWLPQTNVTDENGAKTSSSIALAPFNGVLYSAYRGESSSNLWSAFLQEDAQIG